MPNAELVERFRAEYLAEPSKLLQDLYDCLNIQDVAKRNDEYARVLKIHNYDAMTVDDMLAILNARELADPIPSQPPVTRRDSGSSVTTMAGWLSVYSTNAVVPGMSISQVQIPDQIDVISKDKVRMNGQEYTPQREKDGMGKDWFVWTDEPNTTRYQVQFHTAMENSEAVGFGLTGYATSTGSAGDSAAFSGIAMQEGSTSFTVGIMVLGIAFLCAAYALLIHIRRTEAQTAEQLTDLKRQAENARGLRDAVITDAKPHFEALALEKYKESILKSEVDALMDKVTTEVKAKSHAFYKEKPAEYQSLMETQQLSLDYQAEMGDAMSRCIKQWAGNVKQDVATTMREVIGSVLVFDPNANPEQFMDSYNITMRFHNDVEDRLSRFDIPGGKSFFDSLLLATKFEQLRELADHGLSDAELKLTDTLASLDKVHEAQKRANGDFSKAEDEYKLNPGGGAEAEKKYQQDCQKLRDEIQELGAEIDRLEREKTNYKQKIMDHEQKKADFDHEAKKERRMVAEHKRLPREAFFKK